MGLAGNPALVVGSAVVSAKPPDYVKLTVRIPAALKKQIKLEALEHDCTLNEWVIVKLHIKGRVVIGDGVVVPEWKKP